MHPGRTIAGMRRLPPFDELVAFEAVARHLSVTRAAAELCLTQSAVSHRLRRLETHYGQPLLKRLHPGLALTDAGAALLPELGRLLDRLESLGAPPGRTLRVAAASALCHGWLAGRLPAFAAHHPGIAVDLIAVEGDRGPMPQADVRILWLPAPEPRERQVSLGTELFFPVCSPALLPGRRPLQHPRDLTALPLLHKATSQVGEWSWSAWWKHLSLPSARRAPGELRYTDMGLLMAAATQGAGVALTRSLIAHDALLGGRLLPALPRALAMPSSKVHVARWPSTRDGDRDVLAFAHWLRDEAERGRAAVEAVLAAAGNSLAVPA